MREVRNELRDITAKLDEALRVAPKGRHPMSYPVLEISWDGPPLCRTPGATALILQGDFQACNSLPTRAGRITWHPCHVLCVYSWVAMTAVTSMDAGTWRGKIGSLYAGLYAFLTHFRDAVAAGRVGDFVCRADAEANLGLTLLAMGDQTNGLRWLHDAQKHFQAIQERIGLGQCLENEANYLAQLNKVDDADKVCQKLHTLESRQSP